MAKTNTQKQAPSVAELLKAMSDADRQALLATLKDEGVKISAAKPKADPVYVAERLFTKDSSANAKTPRKAGEIQLLTEKNLMNVLTTWVKGKDAETKIPLIKKSVMEGHSETFANFTLRPVSSK